MSIKALPTIFRMRDKARKEFGPYYCKIKGADKPTNLRTQDYFKARERASEAAGGKHEFTDDRFIPDEPKTETPQTPGQPPTDDWRTDATRAAASGDIPYEYIPPNPNPDIYPPNNPPKPETPKPEGDNTNLPPELMEGLVKQIAATLVELQIHGQEYLFVRIGKIQPGQVHPDSDARKIPAAIWESAVRKWIPNDVPLPEWLVAPILVAVMAGTIQLEGARPIPKAPDVAA